MSNMKDFLKENDKLISSVNEAIMKTQFTPIDGVYFDLNTLKDTRMGLMITLSNPTQLQYLKNGLKNYNLRPNREFIFTYPEFHHTENELQSMYLEKSRHAEIFNMSPDTDLFISLSSIIDITCNHNIKTGKNTPITFYLNTFPFALENIPKQYIDIIKNYILKNRVKLEVFSKNPIEIEKSSWARSQSLFIDDISKLLKTNVPFSTRLFEDKAMMNTFIYAAPTVDKDILQVWLDEDFDYKNNEESEIRFSITEMCLSMFSNFRFSRFNIPVYDSDKVGE